MSAVKQPTGPYAFVRVVRDSPVNDKIKRGEIPGPLIYDFKVLRDGEHVATFWRYMAHYELLDRIGRPVVEPGRTWSKHVGEKARSQALFLKTLEKCAEAIPTARQCATAQRNERRSKERAKEAARREKAKARVRAAGPVLLEALKGMLDAMDDGSDEPTLVAARAAVAKATGGSHG